MDPRARRSRDRLTAAVLSFADSGRLDDVTVSELARAAGVTRDTFYRHAPSVTDLLTLALAEKLEEFGAASVTGLPEAADLPRVLRGAENGLLRHIVENANVYRTALGGRSAAPVHRVVIGWFRDKLELALRTYPEIAPLPLDRLGDEGIAMVAAYAAAGFLGAVEVWLSEGDLADIEGAARIIAAAAPAWWASAAGHSRPL